MPWLNLTCSRTLLVRSAIAGALCGLNAHASNIASAICSPLAQNTQSPHCITSMEPIRDENDLHVSVTMPSIAVGTRAGLGPGQAGRWPRAQGYGGTKRKLYMFIYIKQTKIIYAYVKKIGFSVLSSPRLRLLDFIFVSSTS